MKTNLKCLIGLFFVFMPLIGQCATVNVDKPINNFEVRNNQMILTFGDNEPKSDSSNNGTENKQSENAETKPDENDDEQSEDDTSTAPAEEAKPDQSKTENTESDTQKSTQSAPAPTKSTSRLKSEPENAEKCKEKIRVDVTEIVGGESPKTTLIPDSDFESIKEQYKEYKQQKDKGDFKSTAEEELKRNMVEIYCEGVGNNSNTTNGNTKSNGSEPNNAQNGDDDELVNKLKAEVQQVVDAFKETKEKINKKGA